MGARKAPGFDPAHFDPHSVNAEAQLLDLDRADFEEGLYEFLKGAWPYIDPARWVDGWHIGAICAHLEAVVDGDIQRLIINVPPRHAKSLIVSVAFPAWVWAQPRNDVISGPGVQFLYASYNDKLSLRDSVKCRRLIDSPWYSRLWGERFKLVSDQNTKSRFTNDKGGERLITSVDAGVTGEGGNCFVAGTRVATPVGDIPIERLRAGDEVISFDLDTGTLVTSTVEATASRTARTLCSVVLVDGQTVRCTTDHRIYTQRGFVPAAELHIGELATALVCSADVKHTRIADVVEHHEGMVQVYDVQVARHHCFFAEGILVHNCIVADDPNSAADVVSEAQLENTRQWWTEAMPTRANDPARAAWIVIQQRLAEDDLTGHILEHEADGWTHLCLPGRYEPERSYHTSIGWKDPRTEPGELLWPERFSDEELKRLERRMGPWVFNGQIQQRPEPKGGGIVRRDWWRLWTPDAWPPMSYIIAWLDTAYTEEQLNDPSGMIVWGVYSDPRPMSSRIIGSDGHPIEHDSTHSEFAPRVICMYAWTERLELHDLVNKAAEVCRKMKVNTLFIENKASGISVAQELRRLYGRESFGVQLEDPKRQDKAARLYSVQHLFAEGMIYGPDRPWMEAVITQVGQFPRGKHDEFVDCTSGALRKLRDMGLLIRQPEREADLEEERRYRGREQPLYSV